MSKCCVIEGPSIKDQSLQVKLKNAYEKETNCNLQFAGAVQLQVNVSYFFILDMHSFYSNLLKFSN